MVRNEELIGIFDNDNFTQVLEDIVPLKLSVKQDSQTMTHPVEDGSKISDHQIFNLTEITFNSILSNRDFTATYQSLLKAYKSYTLFTVQTKVNIYKNMLIKSIPHTETVESGINLTIGFIEFNEQKTLTKFAPKYASDSSTSNRGTQNGSEVGKNNKKSFLKGLING